MIISILYAEFLESTESIFIRISKLILLLQSSFALVEVEKKVDHTVTEIIALLGSFVANRLTLKSHVLSLLYIQLQEFD